MSQRSDDRLKLRYVGFCGLDDTLSESSLSAFLSAPLAVKFLSKIEFGCLFRPEVTGKSRFISWNHLEKLLKVLNQSTAEVHMAAHLCSSVLESVLLNTQDGNSFLTKIKTAGFARVQLNATKANNVDLIDLISKQPEGKSSLVKNLKCIFESHPDLEFIFQVNAETKALWEPVFAQPTQYSNTSFLFDESKGTGKLIDTSKVPIDFNKCKDMRFGFAGGLNPNNIGSVLEDLSQKKDIVSASHSNQVGIWIDMESGIRETVMGTGGQIIRDDLSLEKVTGVLQKIQDLMDRGRVEF